MYVSCHYSNLLPIVLVVQTRVPLYGMYVIVRVINLKSPRYPPKSTPLLLSYSRILTSFSIVMCYAVLCWCAAVAMTREKFPEKVPFRLTRMLVNAMEVSGIEGNFRFTCDSVMRVLHQV